MIEEHVMCFKICISSGGYNAEEGHKNSIVEFSHETETWTEIGAMKETRSMLAVTALTYDDFKFYANWCN